MSWCGFLTCDGPPALKEEIDDVYDRLQKAHEERDSAERDRRAFQAERDAALVERNEARLIALRAESAQVAKVLANKWGMTFPPEED